MPRRTTPPRQWRGLVRLCALWRLFWLAGALQEEDLDEPGLRADAQDATPLELTDEAKESQALLHEAFNSWGLSFSGDDDVCSLQGMVRCQQGVVTGVSLSDIPLHPDAALLPLVKIRSLERITLENLGITADLKDVRGLPNLVSLRMRWTNITGSLRDLAPLAPTLRSLRLSGNGIIGDLADLAPLAQLVEVDLRNTAVTGDVAQLSAQPGLRGVWLQRTKVFGDISDMLDGHTLNQLVLHHTRVHGVIDDRWRHNSTHDLETMDVTNTKVRFGISVNLSPRADRPFPRLTRLLVSGTRLEMPVRDFLLPLALNDRLSIVEARGCGLHGELMDMVRGGGIELRFQLSLCDLSRNNITDVWGRPVTGAIFLLSHNPIVSITDEFLEWTRLLDLRGTLIDGSYLLTRAERPWRRGRETVASSLSWQCNGIVPPDGVSTEVFVYPNEFAPTQLCSCNEHYAGIGTQCRPCWDGQVVSEEALDRCTCRAHFAKMRAGSEGNHSCFKCYGQGCTNQSGLSDCVWSHSGPLCAACNEGFRMVSGGDCAPCRPMDLTVRVLLIVLAVAVGVSPIVLVVWLCICCQNVPNPAQDDGDGSESRNRFEILHASGTSFSARCAEMKFQALILLHGMQLYYTLHAFLRVNELQDDSRASWILRAAIQLRINDFLDALGALSPQCLLGYRKGAAVTALIWPALLPVLTTVCLLTSMAFRRPDIGISIGTKLTIVLFIGSMSGSVRLLECVDRDADDESLQEESFMRSNPFYLCHQRGWFWALGRVVAVSNAVFVPLSSMILINRYWRKVGCKSENLAHSAEVRFSGGGAVELTVVGYDNLDTGQTLMKDRLLFVTTRAYTAVCTVAIAKLLGADCVRMTERDNAISVKVVPGPNICDVVQYHESTFYRRQVRQELKRAKPVAHGLMERAALEQAASSDLWLAGSVEVFSRYAYGRAVVCEVLLKLVSISLTALAGVDKAACAVAFVILSSLVTLIGICQPYSSHQQNRLSMVTYGCLAFMSSCLGLGVPLRVVRWVIVVPLTLFVSSQFGSARLLLQSTILWRSLPPQGELRDVVLFLQEVRWLDFTTFEEQARMCRPVAAEMAERSARPLPESLMAEPFHFDLLRAGSRGTFFRQTPPDSPRLQRGRSWKRSTLAVALPPAPEEGGGAIADAAPRRSAPPSALSALAHTGSGYQPPQLPGPSGEPDDERGVAVELQEVSLVAAQTGRKGSVPELPEAPGADGQRLDTGPGDALDDAIAADCRACPAAGPGLGAAGELGHADQTGKGHAGSVDPAALVVEGSAPVQPQLPGAAGELDSGVQDAGAADVDLGALDIAGPAAEPWELVEEGSRRGDGLDAAACGGDAAAGVGRCEVPAALPAQP